MENKIRKEEPPYNPYQKKGLNVAFKLGEGYLRRHRPFESAGSSLAVTTILASSGRGLGVQHDCAWNKKCFTPRGRIVLAYKYELFV